MLQVDWIRSGFISSYFDNKCVHAHATSPLATLPQQVRSRSYIHTLLQVAMSKIGMWVDESQAAVESGGSVPAGEVVAPPCDFELDAAAVAAPPLPESLGTAESAAAAPALILAAVA